MKRFEHGAGLLGRRLACFVLAVLLCMQVAHAVQYPDVHPGHRLEFPRDHGAHPQFRTEWWYVTGWLTTANGKQLGFQVTFFRSRSGLQEDNPSRFAPKQLLFAHAALADPDHGRLRHHQRSGREGFDLAYAREGNTDVRLRDWHLIRHGEEYRARISGSDFSFDLHFATAEPPLLQGDAGYSRKGAQGRQASYYYSRPQLSVSGNVVVEGRVESVSGQAWLDHEWSSEYLAPEAAGWDWAGINLQDGGALMAFRIRTASGRKVWAGGVSKAADGTVRRLAAEDVEFTPLRTWRSPRTLIEYPVVMRLRAAERTLELYPLIDDQELDSRVSTGILYWEGAVTARNTSGVVGRGYLELTGYGGRLDI